MKSYFKLFIAVFFILAVVRTIKSDEITISGVVRYADNNEIVTSGQVRCYNTVTSELEGISEIQPTGDYILICVRRPDLYDLIGFPNIEPDIDWVPTGYPDKTLSSQYVHISGNQNHSGIDIYVQRSEIGGDSPFKGSISGIVLDKNNKPVTEAIVYAKNDNKNYGYAVTDKKGEYTIKNIPFGDYTISANKVASQTSEQLVKLNENLLSNVNFSIEKVISSINKITPVNFKLMQNYPNPFNPSTTIMFALPVSGKVSLQVYNIAGELVAELVNGSKEAGTYEISFNASTLSSGVYLYTLTTGSYTDTKKMILVK